MLGKIKDAIQGRLYKNCIEEYQRELRYQTDPYLLWVKENEQGAEGTKEETCPSIGVVYIENCGRDFSLSGINKEYILFVSENGRIAAGAYSAFMQYFDTHKDVNIVYANEDVWMLGEEGEIGIDAKKRARKHGGDTRDEETAHRIFPWTKPMWSPDTLISFLYFGNIFAVRKSAYSGLEWLGSDDYKKNIYDFALKASEHGKRPGHIEKVLFHAYKRGSREQIEEELMHATDFIGVGAEYDFIRENAFGRRGICAAMSVDQVTGISYPVYKEEGQPLVSIIIPSKDNMDVLKQCICSIYEHTDYPNYEIVVIDNGSAARVRAGLENFKQEYPFKYLYQPMDFNFSRMCNVAVREAAKGKYILLLNDDMEVVEGSWLTRMAGQASLKHVGAVGAKLLYPDSTLIQHVGISNTVYGPGHKLKKMDDARSYYYGRNRFTYDMIGVTAACLLMRRDYYLALNGLYEGLAVAYNDVDLCFRLCSKGLYNVQRNDVVLYHHESLSRGDDMQDENKLKRLTLEKNRLYRRHPKFYGRDPFIGTLLNSGNPEYRCRWLQASELVNLSDCEGKIVERKKLPDFASMNQAMIITVDQCGKEEFAKAVSKNGQRKSYYLIEGWAYVPGADNARYKFKLLLVNSSGRVWEIPIQKRYRKDILPIISDEVNVAMAGFCSWIFEGTLPQGTYDLWLAAKDGCSRQRVYRSMETQLVIGE